MTTTELRDRIDALLEDGLNLEGGEMMMPLKQNEVAYLASLIADLALLVAREGLS